MFRSKRAKELANNVEWAVVPKPLFEDLIEQQGALIMISKFLKERNGYLEASIPMDLYDRTIETVKETMRKTWNKYAHQKDNLTFYYMKENENG